MAPTPTTLSPMLTTPSLANLAVHLPSTPGPVMKTAPHLTTREPHHLRPSTKILLLHHHHQVLMTTPSVPAFLSVDAAAVLTTEDIMDIAVDHTAMNAVAAGADAVVEAGMVVGDAAVANAASTPRRLGAIST